MSTADKIRELKAKKEAATASTVAENKTTVKEEPVAKKTIVCDYCCSDVDDLKKHYKKCDAYIDQHPPVQKPQKTISVDEIVAKIKPMIESMIHDQMPSIKQEPIDIDDLRRKLGLTNPAVDVAVLRGLIKSVKTNFSNLLEPALKHWENSTGYLKIIKNLETSILDLEQFGATTNG